MTIIYFYKLFKSIISFSESESNLPIISSLDLILVSSINNNKSSSVLSESIILLPPFWIFDFFLSFSRDNNLDLLDFVFNSFFSKLFSETFSKLFSEVFSKLFFCVSNNL